MSTKIVVENSMVRIRRVVSVWWVALAVAWATAAMAGPAEDLISAALRGDAAAVQALLAKGADVNAKTRGGGTALFAASQNGHLDVVQALLANGADVNIKDSNGRTALDAAERHADVRALLMQAGGKP